MKTSPLVFLDILELYFLDQLISHLLDLLVLRKFCLTEGTEKNVTVFDSEYPNLEIVNFFSSLSSSPIPQTGHTCSFITFPLSNIQFHGMHHNFIAARFQVQGLDQPVAGNCKKAK